MITRYAMSWGKDEDGSIYISPTEQPKGNWVKYEDYARLQQERVHDLNQIGGLQQELARLKAEVERRGEENDHLHKGIYSLSLNMAQLKDEIERLNKTEEYLQNTLNQYALDDMRLTAELARLRASSFVTAVPVEEYDRLKAEVERSTAQYNGIIDTQLKVIDELKAEMDRLTKAGDAMADVIGFAMARTDGQDPKLVREWRAAKEGKPSV